MGNEGCHEEGCCHEGNEEACNEEERRPRQEEFQGNLCLDDRVQGGTQGPRHQGLLPMRRLHCKGQGIPCQDSCALQEVDRRSSSQNLARGAYHVLIFPEIAEDIVKVKLYGVSNLCPLK